MPPQVSRLRHWFAAAAVLAVAVVAGAYFYARHRVQNALKQVPEKIGIEIQQSADGFTISRSEAGRTLFKIQASKAVQFKLGGHTELHDVAITLYGRDSNRFDQIYGSDFEYDPRSGEVSAKGEVQIDLEANPAGLTSTDQTTPKELKNPIHLKTSGIVFQEKTGDAYTKEKVEFRVPQASGSAVGMSYTAKGSALVLQSQVQVQFSGSSTARIMADHGTLSKNPRLVVLDHVRMEDEQQRCQADKATIFLRPDNTVSRALATGNVFAESQDPKQPCGNPRRRIGTHSRGRARPAHSHLLRRRPTGERRAASDANYRRPCSDEFCREKYVNHGSHGGQRQAGAAPKTRRSFHGNPKYGTHGLGCGFLFDRRSAAGPCRDRRTGSSRADFHGAKGNRASYRLASRYEPLPASLRPGSTTSASWLRSTVLPTPASSPAMPASPTASAPAVRSTSA